MRALNAADIRAVAEGSAVLASGGGGDPRLGMLAALQALDAGSPPSLITMAELANDDLIAVPFMVGAPVAGLEKFPYGVEFDAALDVFGALIGRPISALLSAEIGGINSVLPLALAAKHGLPVVDGDLIGRAVPEMQLTTFTLNGMNACPVVLADEHGNTVTIQTKSNADLERVARALSIEFGAMCVGVGFSHQARDASRTVVADTVSLALDIGVAIQQERAHGGSPVARILELCGGQHLFTGKITDVDRTIAGGFAVGTVQISGVDADAGRVLSVDLKNEYMVARHGDTAVVTTPEIIVLLDMDSGSAITSERVRYGYRVAVLAIPCDAQWRTAPGLELMGPRAFGFDVDYIGIPSA